MRKILLIAALLIIPTCPALAEDLGSIGPMYDIAERDLIVVMQEKLQAMQESGELQKVEEDYREQVIAGIERPRAVPGIKPAQSAKTYYIDPILTLQRDVVDENGKIMFPKGMRINPLDYTGLNQVLVFFDGDDEKQREFVAGFLKEEKLPVKPILIAGAPLELMREWQREIFFDQGGVLSKHFNITVSPATVRQEGKRIRVDEISL